MIIIHVKDKIFIPSSLKLVFKKKSIHKLYNKLPGHFNNLQNTQLFWRKLKPLLLQQTFSSLQECVL